MAPGWAAATYRSVTDDSCAAELQAASRALMADAQRRREKRLLDRREASRRTGRTGLSELDHLTRLLRAPL
jgi:hypothetical protein